MRICFVVDEIFEWGLYGGFGKLTRDIGKGLVEKGIEVFILVRKYSAESLEKQRTIEIRDGMTIIGTPKGYVQRALSGHLYKLSEADIYHSQNPSFNSWLVMKFCPTKKHIITFQDPGGFEELWKVLSLDSRLNNLYYKYNKMWRWDILDFFSRKAVRNADNLFCQAKYIRPFVKKKYNLNYEPEFLPNPIDIPTKNIKKAEKPTVCFIGRWDLEKRPEIFFELAKKFPDVNFIATGKAHNKKRDVYLRKKYKNIPNLWITGFVIGKKKSEILEKSWVMINTSIKECLPISFLEATAYKCAILSSENPDNFASNFGFHVKKDNFELGLKFLLEKNRWKKLGKRGYEYTKRTHEFNKVIKDHIKIYDKLA